MVSHFVMLKSALFFRSLINDLIDQFLGRLDRRHCFGYSRVIL